MTDELSFVSHWRMRLEFPRAPELRARAYQGQIESRLQPRPQDWMDWTWQMRRSLSRLADFEPYFDLSASERRGFELKGFQIRCTPYYAALAAEAGSAEEYDPLRLILMPRAEESSTQATQEQLDPLGERRNLKAPRLVHRYPDRALFLVTDFCSVYCRYCTRKHFTGGELAFAREPEYQQALEYIRHHKGLREVILSGGDPLTLSDAILDRVLFDLRQIDHIEIVRIGTRMPVVCPMRVTEDLVRMLRRHKPVFVMTHFNHPRELTQEAAEALERFVDHGHPVFNQMVLLNGVNNDARIVQALSRRLLYLRVKPYYMFQCDPSQGTDHLRTSVEDSLRVQRELWGHLSGLAMPQLSLDIPDGGGKAGLVPQFEVRCEGNEDQGTRRTYVGWDGIEAEYMSPPRSRWREPLDAQAYEQEWASLRRAKINEPNPANG